MRELELDGILAHHRGLALFLPAKTPQATVQALYREAARIVALPEVRERLVATGHEVIGSSPEVLGEKVRRDAEKYRKIILESNMQQEQ